MVNRLRSGTGRCRVILKKWGYLDTEYGIVICECYTEPQTMELNQGFEVKDIAEFNNSAKDCVQL